MHFRVAKIEVATSVCTGGRNCPPDSSTAMGSRPAPCEKRKEKSHPGWDDFSFLARGTEKDIDTPLVFYRYCSFGVADDFRV